MKKKSVQNYQIWIKYWQSETQIIKPSENEIPEDDIDDRDDEKSILNSDF